MPAVAGEPIDVSAPVLGSMLNAETLLVPLFATKANIWEGEDVPPEGEDAPPTASPWLAHPPVPNTMTESNKQSRNVVFRVEAKEALQASQ